MKLIHTGDLHLGAKMESGLPPARARERRNELLMSFSRLVEAAQSEGAQAVILAGDLFDTARVSDKTRRYVADVVLSHPTLLFLCVEGNHDAGTAPAFAGGVVPANWKVFSSQGWETVWLDEQTAISGASATDFAGVYDNVPRPVTADGTTAFHIVCLHGQVVRTGHAAADTVVLKELQGKDIDYLALGHEHSFRCEPLDRRGVWAYAGCPEGRGFDECGDKGYVVLDTTADEASRVRFVPFAGRRLHRVEVALDGCESFREIQSRVEAAVADISSRDMLQVVLTGALEPEVDRDTLHLTQALEGRFYMFRLTDNTKMLLHPEEYALDVSLKGEFIRTVMASSMTQQQKDRVIACGLRVLRGEEVDA